MSGSDLYILDKIETPIFVLEPDDAGRPRYTGFNRMARRISQLELTDVVGKTALELYPGRYGQMAYGYHCRCIETATAMKYELTLPIGGTHRLIRTHLEPVPDPSGAITRLIGTSADISVQQDVAEMATEASSLQNEMEEFIGLAAHDLRSPMRRVKAIATMLRDDFAARDDDETRLIDMLESVAAQSMALITDVIGHMQATRTTEQVGEFELRQLCNEVMLMLDPENRHDSLAPTSVIYGDRIATQIVLRNLVDNAIKHNEGRQLQLKVATEHAEHGYYRISVSDNGAGFSPDGMRYLNQGKLGVDSGYGFASVRRLVLTRGGQIWAENRDEGDGALVTFSLPGVLVAA